MDKHPPKFFRSFFRWFCHPRLHQPIEGDLMELYYERLDELGKRKADLLFIKDVLILFRKDIIRPAGGTYRLNFYGMLKHNLLITLRSFKRYQSTFWINLIGLTVGLAASTLIFLWVNDEISKDQFHAKGDQIYQVLRTKRTTDRPTRTHDSNSELLIPEMKSELAEVEMAVPIMREFPYAILSIDDKTLKSSGLFVGNDFFNLFSFNLTNGNPNEVLTSPSSIVISKSLSEKMFGDENTIGKTIHLLDNTDGEVLYEADYQISGIFDDSQLNTSEDFEFVLPYQVFEADRVASWGSNSSRVFIQLNEQTNLSEFEAKLDAFYQRKMSQIYVREGNVINMHLQPYLTRHLYNRYENGVLTGGRISYVYLFSGVGLLILLVACINFINLSTALATRRLKEVGVKKVFGTSKGFIISQHLMESFVLVLISTLLALILLSTILPGFSAITNKTLTLQFSLETLIGLGAIIIITALLAGTYPALFLSGLRPLDALSAKLKTSTKGQWLRKGLTIFQFSLSIVLIISVMTVSQQVDYVRSKNLGYDRENVITFARDGQLVNNMEPFMNRLATIPGVVHSTRLEGSISQFNNSGGGYGGDGRPYIDFTFAYVGYDFVETIGLELKEGRSFSREFTNEHKKIILNETAIAAMGLADPIGKVVNIRGNREIIGILKDYHYQSLHEAIKPMFLIFEPADATTIAVKLQAGREMETIEELGEVYQEYNAGLPFQFKFLDEEYEALYQSELQVASLSTYFASIAIIISCLGLFGLTTFMTQRRIKEIGIRKVLGSSRIRIVRLLGGNVMKMLVAAIIISTPVAFYLLGSWLENFAYHIDLSPWLFVLGGFTTVLIACFTVGFETWKAASVNPVECIKDE
ncbi:MAG: ABC transporter permease [Cytophagales bacterium]|nr:ABC transporter permease [Cytophagales bacterium]